MLAPPLVTRRWHATINGAAATVSASGQVTVRKLPANVVLSH